MRNRLPLIVAAAAGLVLAAPADPLAAQSRPRPRPRDPVVVYEREVFQYDQAGRRDPFSSLLATPETGTSFEELALLGVLYNPEGSRSVAILAQAGSDRRIRARVGDRIGTLRVVAIRPTSVDVVSTEFGVARRGTLELRKATPKGSKQ